jgi:hypothetical protein
MWLSRRSSQSPPWGSTTEKPARIRAWPVIPEFYGQREHRGNVNNTFGGRGVRLTSLSWSPQSLSERRTKRCKRAFAGRV